jgi:hydrogenase maturation factor HypF (carbamoyltransferase family)
MKNELNQINEQIAREKLELEQLKEAASKAAVMLSIDHTNLELKENVKEKSAAVAMQIASIESLELALESAIRFRESDKAKEMAESRQNIETEVIDHIAEVSTLASEVDDLFDALEEKVDCLVSKRRELKTKASKAISLASMDQETDLRFRCRIIDTPGVMSYAIANRANRLILRFGEKTELFVQRNPLSLGPDTKGFIADGVMAEVKTVTTILKDIRRILNV